MIVIPKPGRKIPKTVENPSPSKQCYSVNSFVDNDLRRLWRVGMSRAKALSVWDKPVRPLHIERPAGHREVFTNLGKDSGLSSQAGTRSASAFLRYEGGNCHV